MFTCWDIVPLKYVQWIHLWSDRKKVPSINIPRAGPNGYKTTERVTLMLTDVFLSTPVKRGLRITLRFHRINQCKGYANDFIALIQYPENFFSEGSQKAIKKILMIVILYIGLSQSFDITEEKAISRGFRSWWCQYLRLEIDAKLNFIRESTVEI